MAAIAFDPLEFTHALEEAGFTRSQAELVAQVEAAMFVQNFDALLFRHKATEHQAGPSNAIKKMTKAIQAIEKYWLSLSLCILLIITTLSLWPLPNFPAVPGSDKTHHLIAYAALVFPAALRKPVRWIWLVVFFIFYSGLIELIQPYVNRYGEWADMLANTAGIVCGITLAAVVTILRRRPREE